MNPRFSLRIFPVLVFVLIFAAQSLPAKGKFEFGFHYSTWSFNLLRGPIESALNDAMKTNFRDKFLEEIQKDHPDYSEKNYEQNIKFDSGGDNFGFEIRFYPGGERGSFSLGFSVEKTAMKFSLPEVSGSLVVENTTTHETGDFEGKANGEFLIKPLSFHLSFRWDIKPSWRVRPYITFGLGLAPSSAIDNAKLSYDYNGTLTIPGEDPETYQGSDEKTGKQLKEDLEKEGEKFPINFVPFIQLSFGLKGAITENICLLVDAGIWDGFILRGGVAFRI